MLPVQPKYFYVKFMQSKLSPQHQQFYDSACDFVRSHGSLISTWQKALLAHGFTVPNWPKVFGGPDWSTTERYLWFKACALEGAPVLDQVGITHVAPRLFDHAHNQPILEHLEAMRGLESYWAIGWYELNDRPLQLKGRTLHGSAKVQSVSDNWHWALCRCVDEANKAYLVILPSQDRQDGRITHMEFENFTVEPHQLLEAQEDRLTWADTADQAMSTHAIWLGKQWSALADIVASFEDEDLQAKYSEIGVSVMAINALEQRFWTAVENRQLLPFDPHILHLKAREIFLQLGELQVDTFGYYALPDLDKMLNHNEGVLPVWPTRGDVAPNARSGGGALIDMASSLREVLQAQAQQGMLLQGDDFALKDRAAEGLFDQDKVDP